MLCNKCNHEVEDNFAFCPICGQNTLSLMASGAMCLILVLYWVCYFIVRRKY